MAPMGVYDQVKKAFQDIVAPEIHALRGEIQRLDGRMTGLEGKLEGKIDGLDTKIGALDTKIGALDMKIGALDTKIVSMKGELIAEIRRVDVRIDGVERELHTTTDIRERLAALEARQRP